MIKVIDIFKTIGVCILGFVFLVLSQLGANMIANLIPFSKEFSFMVSCFIYIFLVTLAINLFYKFIIKEKLNLGKIPDISSMSKWVCLGVFLPLLLDLLVIFLTKGEWIQNNTTSTGMLVSFAIFGIAIPAGVCEELIFRGFMFDFVKKKFGLTTACVLPSFIFALVHILNGELNLIGTIMLLVAGTVVGVMFSMIRVVTGNIWCGIIMHILWDLLCFNQQNTLISLQDNPLTGNSIIGYKFYDPSLFITGGDYGIETSVIGVILYALVAAILIHMYIKQKMKFNY
ncbi:hypothetical protein BCR22_11780 [Enterococcus plantarum]|uniref:type II CAAX endopeptidase family protein n=1 Tax=Enterococcus plantarum TaxID=1077675 RepID=UPI00084E018A|nr:type II CAAX endopeptidase family protein [Enterococcus plantarum]OEG18044.1 hypothetical protein BCR22_11780 [Enterococcus plantarum]